MRVYIDGKYFSRENAKISVFDHGFLYGDGVFEGMRIYGGLVFRLEAHIKRLAESARTLMLPLPIPEAEIVEATRQTVSKNGLKDGYIRLVVSRGEGDLGLNPFKCRKSHLIIIADKLALYPARFYEEGLEVITAATRRTAGDALSPEVKSLNYVNSIMAQIEALNAGVVEAIMLSHEGYVIECTGDNIFIVKNGCLITPPVWSGILGGITRAEVLDIAEAMSLKTREALLTRHEIYNADECFLTGSAAEMVPVVKVDRRVIGDGKPGPLTGEISRAFHERVLQHGTDCY